MRATAEKPGMRRSGKLILQADFCAAHGLIEASKGLPRLVQRIARASAASNTSKSWPTLKLPSSNPNCLRSSPPETQRSHFFAGKPILQSQSDRFL